MSQASTYPLGTSGTALGVNAGGTVQRFTLREVLTGNRTYYVATTGSDSNDGLSSGSPKTLQGALNTLATVDFNGQTVVVQLADGTYTGSFTVPRCTGLASAESLRIRGNTTTPTNTRVQGSSDYTGTIVVDGPGCVATTEYFQIGGSANSFGLYAADNAMINLGPGMDFSTGCYAHVHARLGGIVSGYSNYTISGGGACHVQCETGGRIQIFYCTVTITAAVTFSSGFLNLSGSSIARMDGITWTNAANVTGARYVLSALTFVNTGGAGASYFPGTTAGSLDPLASYA